MKAFSFILILLLFSQLRVSSQTCCSGGVPVSGSVGLYPLNTKGFQINLSYDLNSLNTLKNYSKTLPGNERERTTRSILMEASYSLTERLSLYGFVSYVSQKREINNIGYNDVALTEGIGDAVLMPGYLLVDRFSFSWYFSAGIKFPLGKADIRNDDGILINPDLQPGSGAYDALVFNMFRYEAARGHSFWNSFALRETGTNSDFRVSDQYSFGNEIVTAFGWSKNILFLNVIIEPSASVSYRYAGNDLINQDEIPNTGGNWLFASSGIAIFIKENLKLFSSFSFPLFSKPAGVQLTTSYRFNAGIYFSFQNNRNKFLNI